MIEALMRLLETFRNLRWLGLRSAWLALKYAVLRDRLDHRHQRRAEPAPVDPGRLVQAEPGTAGAVFTFERAELGLTFIRSDVVRVGWLPGQPPPPIAQAGGPAEPVECELTQTNDGWRLASDELAVWVDGAGALAFARADGTVLRRERPPTRQGDRWSSSAILRPEESIYGLGERVGQFDLRPGNYRLWNSEPGGSYDRTYDPLYLTAPIYHGIHPSGSYLLFYENPHDGQLDAADSVQLTFEGGQLRYLFFAGEPRHTLKRLAQLLGQPAMAPRWSLGYHQSRWGYLTQDQVREVLSGFADHDLPLAALHLDIDYMRGYRVFTVDQHAFPDLSGLARRLENDHDARLVLILDPGVKVDPDYDFYRQGVERDAFVRLPGGRRLEAVVWPGLVSFPDFSHPDVRHWWGQAYAWLLGQGVAGFWHDMNEPSTFAAWGDRTFPRQAQHHLDGLGGDHRTGHNLYGLQMNQAAYEALRQLQPDRRPWLLTRSGWAGVARYAWTWTGDTETSWQALEHTLGTVLGMGLSGIPYCGPDIGGFSGAPSAELYLRWFQLAAFLPFFRTHSSKTSPPREPWQFGPEVLAATRNLLHLRRSLMPYLYSLAAEAHEAGWPLARPLFWAGEQQAPATRLGDSFLLGDQLLVAPVVTAHTRSRPVYFPAGSWYDFWNGQQYTGPSERVVAAELDRVPLFVRAGAVLPLEVEGRLTLHLYPPDKGGNVSQLYSDAGDGYGPSRWDRFAMASSDQGYRLTWQADGEFAFPHKTVNLILHGRQPTALMIDGESKTLVTEVSVTAPFGQADITLSSDP